MADFSPRHPQDVLTLIHEHPLAWVVSGRGGEFHATPLPLLPECDEGGALVSLLGHIALSNPHCAVLQADGEALILFSGPQGYISPSLVADPAWAPTWNYAVARFQVAIAMVPDETDHAIRSLVAKAEAETGGDWRVENMGDRYALLRKRVVAFRAHIRSSRVTFKLGQDESPGNFGTIEAGLADRRLAAWMRGQRGQP